MTRTAIASIRDREALIRSLNIDRVLDVPDWVADDEDPDEAALWWLTDAVPAAYGDDDPFEVTVEQAGNPGRHAFYIEWTREEVNA